MHQLSATQQQHTTSAATVIMQQLHLEAGRYEGKALLDLTAGNRPLSSKAKTCIQATMQYNLIPKHVPEGSSHVTGHNRQTELPVYLPELQWNQKHE